MFHGGEWVNASSLSLQYLFWIPVMWGLLMTFNSVLNLSFLGNLFFFFMHTISYEGGIVPSYFGTVEVISKFKKKSLILSLASWLCEQPLDHAKAVLLWLYLKRNGFFRERVITKVKLHSCFFGWKTWKKQVLLPVVLSKELLCYGLMIASLC